MTTYSSEYYLRNKEKIKERNKKFREDNPNYSQNYNRTYYLNNKETISESNKQYALENKDKIRSYCLKHRFGITIEQYNELLKHQNGVCAICNKSENAKDKNGNPRLLAVDHDHQTGKIRGLLCNDCNIGLGNFHDKIELLDKAKIYLSSKRI